MDEDKYFTLSQSEMKVNNGFYAENMPYNVKVNPGLNLKTF